MLKHRVFFLPEREKRRAIAVYNGFENLVINNPYLRTHFSNHINSDIR